MVDDKVKKSLEAEFLTRWHEIWHSEAYNDMRRTLNISLADFVYFPTWDATGDFLHNI